MFSTPLAQFIGRCLAAMPCHCYKSELSESARGSLTGILKDLAWHSGCCTIIIIMDNWIASLFVTFLTFHFMYAKSQDEAAARQWLEQYDRGAADADYNRGVAYWEYYTNITDYNQKLMVSGIFSQISFHLSSVHLPSPSFISSFFIFFIFIYSFFKLKMCLGMEV